MIASVKRKLIEIFNTKKDIVSNRKEFYEKGFKDGYQKTQEDRVKDQTEAFGKMLNKGNNG